MAEVNVYEAMKELFGKLLSGDEEVAELAASDPEGLMAAYDITEQDLDEVDFRQVMADSYTDYEDQLPESSYQALQGYVNGEPAPAHYEMREPPAHSGGHQGVEQAAQHLQYVTYATHEHNDTVRQEIVNRQLTIDNSDQRSFDVDNRTEVDVDGDLTGEVEVAPNNATAIGEQAVATSGEGNLVNTGDAAVVADQVGAANTGTLEGVQVGDDLQAPVNTGTNEGVISEGDVRGTVVGDGNQTANLDIDTSGGAGGSADGFGGSADGFGGNATGGAATGPPGRGSDTFGGDANASGRGGEADGFGGNASGGAGGGVGDLNFNFGSGDQSGTEIGGDVDDSAFATGGNADNVSDNFVDDGSALATDLGDAEARQEITEDSFNDFAGIGPRPLEEELAAEAEAGLVEEAEQAEQAELEPTPAEGAPEDPVFSIQPVPDDQLETLPADEELAGA